MLASQARYAAVMDADLQHDERLLLPMLAKLRSDEADIVIGTRYAQGGGADTFSTSRKWISLLATRIANKVLGLKLSDPLSGFFMLRRNVVETYARKLSTHGFKILLDIVSTAGKSLRLVELPYQFAGPANSTRGLRSTTPACCWPRRRPISCRCGSFSSVWSDWSASACTSSRCRSASQ